MRNREGQMFYHYRLTLLMTDRMNQVKMREGEVVPAWTKARI